MIFLLSSFSASSSQLLDLEEKWASKNDANEFIHFSTADTMMYVDVGTL